MGIVRTIALVILGVSALIFIALFGRLPSFRKTPISFLYKTIWIYIPNGISYVDSILLGGRLSYCWGRTGRYVLHENHPLVLILFLSLLLVGELLFIPSAWPRISAVHRSFIPLVAVLPYVFLYASVVTKSFITRKNHAEEMHRYPHDGVIFHWGQRCRTCHIPKPARSKHCSFCNACVSRHDHHCIWLMNCVGRENYVYFLSLLLSLSVMLVYGSYLGYVVLCQTRDQLLSGVNLRLIEKDWTTFLNIWFVVLAADARVGVIFLLALMTAPLAMAFLLYHTYLIWAGMTTNESGKWSELKDDVADGFIFRSTRREIYGTTTSAGESSCSWPGSSDQVFMLTDGGPPTEGHSHSLNFNGGVQEVHAGPVDLRWIRVHSMREVDNIYDLGFWDNLRDAVKLPIR